MNYNFKDIFIANLIGIIMQLLSLLNQFDIKNAR